MKIKKILIGCICAVVVLASIAFGYFIAKNPSEYEKTPSASENSTSEYYQENTSTKEENSYDDVTYLTDTYSYEPTSKSTTEADEEDIKRLIIGKWSDDANLYGYEFFEDGTVNITLFNMSSLNLDSSSGVITSNYTLSGNILNIKYTLYSETINHTYSVSVTKTKLTLIDEDGKKSILTKDDGDFEEMEGYNPALIGKWSSELNAYEFLKNGKVNITYIDLSGFGIELPLNTTAQGTYEIDGDELTISYSIYSSVIEKKFKYSIDNDILTLTDLENGKSGEYRKKV